ncbi:MAG: DUF975 family protein [Dysgonamonadaceae bacterium]|nr:DUF975 family protein [Dysgonamonadaceae bacterium]
MKTENAVLMRMAKESLKGKWGLAIGTYIVYVLIVGALQFIPFVGAIGVFIIGGPLILGLSIFSLSISRDQDAKLEQIFEGFNNFGTALVVYLLVTLFVFLWTLLLIIPGVIASISYSMTFYILVDDKSIQPMKAIDKSKKMMYGYKWKFFCLGLRFLGLSLLCILTLGIGFLWLMPYMQVSTAKFYEDVKTNFIAIESI